MHPERYPERNGRKSRCTAEIYTAGRRQVAERNDGIHPEAACSKRQRPRCTQKSPEADSTHLVVSKAVVAEIVPTTVAGGRQVQAAVQAVEFQVKQRYGETKSKRQQRRGSPYNPPRNPETVSRNEIGTHPR